MVITRIGESGNCVDGGEWIDGIDGNGNLYACKNPKKWHKTGRHFPLMEELLKQMREEKKNE